MRLVPLPLLAGVFLSCSSAPPSLLDSAPTIHVASPLRGIPDPGADPAVVLLDLGGQARCTGALLAADVVLTARRCIALPTEVPCPAPGPAVDDSRDLTSIRVLVGDDAASAVERARGRAVLLPPGDALCGADIALLLLDRTLDDIAPLVVLPTGAAVGDHVRSVSYGGGRKLVRDHVPVTATSSRELEVSEAPCDGTPGGPAIEEASGQIVGVLSRGAPCGATEAFDVDTRADAFSALVGEALAQGTISHASHQARQKKGAVDLGATCTQGSDCAAGVCVDYAGAQYCTRPCGPHDGCPTRTRCMTTRQSAMVCIQE